MAKLIISLAQMQIALGDPRRNLANMERLATDAAALRSHILVLPELWSTGYALDRASELGSELNKGIFAEISRVATERNLSIIGSVLEKRGLEVSNSAPFFASNGRMMGVYRKVHLFRLMDEDKWLQPGAAPLSLDLPWGTTSLAICYDLRFPELFRRYAVDDHTRLIFIPAEWPLERIEHWRTLLIARAIENQCYIIACNAAGQIGDTVFGGHSMIVDPWGKIIVEAGESPQLITAQIELDTVDEVRQRIPIFEDLRRDLYS